MVKQGKMQRVLAIVPAYNEAGSIEAVVRELAALRAKGEASVDVLVVDDGSTDDTLLKVPRLPGVRVVRLPFNLGIGAAVQTGYRYAARHGYEVAVQVDGDGQHPAGQLPKLLRKMEDTDADFVIGSRFLEDGDYRQTAARSAGIGVLRTMLSALTGRRFSDCTSGFRAANRQVIAAFAHWYPEDFPEPEVALLLHRAGFRIEEVQVAMRQRMSGQTSIPLFWGLFYILKVGAALLLDTMRNPWPVGVMHDIENDDQSEVPADASSTDTKRAQSHGVQS